jgi:hypothetical protein
VINGHMTNMFGQKLPNHEVLSVSKTNTYRFLLVNGLDQKPHNAFYAKETCVG